MTMAQNKKVYRVVFRGSRRGEGFFISVVRRSADSIRKMTAGIYPTVQFDVIPEPELTEADAKRFNALLVELKFKLI
jgi:hypothetical protein